MTASADVEVLSEHGDKVLVAEWYTVWWVHTQSNLDATVYFFRVLNERLRRGCSGKPHTNYSGMVGAELVLAVVGIAIYSVLLGGWAAVKGEGDRSGEKAR